MIFEYDQSIRQQQRKNHEYRYEDELHVALRADVYLTRRGTAYHCKSGCYGASLPVMRWEAENSGKKPCKQCFRGERGRRLLQVAMEEGVKEAKKVVKAVKEVKEVKKVVKAVEIAKAVRGVKKVKKVVKAVEIVEKAKRALDNHVVDE
jgi:hypothetical protein